MNERVHAPLRKHNLSPSQFGVLEALHHLGPLSQKVLSEKILKSPGNLTMVIDNLIKRDLVLREIAPEDRRRCTVSLTKNGAALIAEIVEPHKGRIEEALKSLTLEELQQITQLTKKVLAVDRQS